MKLYNDIIQETRSELGRADQRWVYEAGAAWADLGENEVILRREAAYELGAEGREAVHYLCVGTEKGVLEQDEILLYGDDLPAIREDRDYARIAILSLHELPDDEDEAYRVIRDLEFTKYRIFPRGFMMRISSSGNREQVRVRRADLDAGLTFARVGANFVEAYHRKPQVEHVQIIFVTRPELVKPLEALGRKCRALTDALNHIFEGMPTNCSACQLKPICDEVEGMRELHFKHRAK